ncbi:LysR family transcriptional regulator [Streptomyces sp. S07_1.15]|uniref:LysR family transcriptional regulator n=1 Tax=Streptomyces sp. S07_1.15 TaxID=2873925 RepID=UPI001D1577F6|nr:LysR family transcriptional regulator [Streptomyces sp. S07_1.15]MCC3655598.1 LysR family transcriptional regulator [Streptomyces sp. S07_1.15]
MTFDDLRTFVAVCEAGSLSAVAREQHRTQPAVSQHVRRLERELGLGLLERRPRGVTPTHAGRILYAAAAEGIGGIDLALRRLRELLDGETGSLRITTGATTVRHFMAEAVVAYRERYPGVSLEFQTENSSRGCFAALAADDADLAWITIGPPVRGIEQRPVVELPWVLAVRDDDPLAEKSAVGPGDLAGIQHIRLPGNSTSGSRLDSQLPRLGVPSASATSVADWDTAVLLAELGLGHALVPAMPGPPPPGRVRLVPVPALPPLSVGWAVRQWEALSPLARAFADTVDRSLAERSGPAPGEGDGAGREDLPGAAAGPPSRNRGVTRKGVR